MNEEGENDSENQNRETNGVLNVRTVSWFSVVFNSFFFLSHLGAEMRLSRESLVSASVTQKVHTIGDKPAAELHIVYSEYKIKGSLTQELPTDFNIQYMGTYIYIQCVEYKNRELE